MSRSRKNWKNNNKPKVKAKRKAYYAKVQSRLALEERYGHVELHGKWKHRKRIPAHKYRELLEEEE